MAGNTGKEIELKYLIYEDGIDYTTPGFRKLYQSVKFLELDIFRHGSIINQGYLSLKSGIDISNIINMQVNFDPKVARLRSKSFFDSDKDKEYYFTLKGDGMLERDELEERIKRELYLQYWKETEGKRVKKVRYEKKHSFYTIEFDSYIDDRPDLIIAEIEVPNRTFISGVIPIGKDVTYDPRYKNSNLAK
ncbi:MAG TPA: hypothetical protein VEC16_03010 [Alphaproteobacteria bacterium]|nr:hypothetical protein [Alphaproteobacteria bacterium]